MTEGVKRLAIVAAVCSAFVCSAGAREHQYVPGKLIDLRRYDTTAILPKFCLAIQVGDLSYLVQYERVDRVDFDPRKLVVGDALSVRVKDDNLWFLTGRPHNDEAKGKIVRRERIQPSSGPATCSLPVAVSPH